MTTEEIEKFLGKSPEEAYVKIYFKKRDSIYGLFVKDRDYRDLSSKNFWRIVTKVHFDEYKKSKNVNLSRIFSGSDFAKLSVLEDTF